MDVCVRHFEAGDEVTRALRAEGFNDCLADLLGHRVALCPESWVHIRPAVNFLDRDDQRVAVCDRLNGEECGDFLIPVDKATGQFAVDDLGEYTSHAFPC